MDVSMSPTSSEDELSYPKSDTEVRPGHTRGGSAKGRSRGRGRGRGQCKGRGRSSGKGRGHGRGQERDPFARLSVREKEVSCGVWRHQESNAYVFPFSGPTPGPAVHVDGDSARKLFERICTEGLDCS